MTNTSQLRKRFNLKEYTRIATVLLELALKGPQNLSQLSDLLIKEGLRPVSARPATTRIINYLEKMGFVRTIGKGPRGARLVDITPKTLYYIVSLALDEFLCIPIEIISRYGEQYNINDLKEMTNVLQIFVDIFGQKCKYDSKFVRELTFFIAYSIEEQGSTQDGSGIMQNNYLGKVEEVLKYAIINVFMELIDFFEKDAYEDISKLLENEDLLRKMNDVVSAISKIINEFKRSNIPFAKEILRELKTMLHTKKKSLEYSLKLVDEISKIID